MNYHSLKMQDLHRIKTKRGIKISYSVKKIDLIRLLEKDSQRKGLSELQQREEYDRMIREDEEREREDKERRKRHLEMIGKFDRGELDHYYYKDHLGRMVDWSRRSEWPSESLFDLEFGFRQ